MKKWMKENCAMLIIGGIIGIVAALVVVTIIAYVMYGGKPITEIPMWALILLFRR